MLGLAIANLNIFYLTKNHNPPLQVLIATCKGEFILPILLLQILLSFLAYPHQDPWQGKYSKQSTVKPQRLDIP